MCSACMYIIVNENAISDFPDIDVFNIFIQTKKRRREKKSNVGGG